MVKKSGDTFNLPELHGVLKVLWYASNGNGKI